MTNIWAGIYKEIREPFFEIEDPYTLSEKKEEKEKEEKGEKKHKEGPEEEKSEEKKGEKENDKPKRWWDDDGDGKGWEKGEVEGKFKKKKVKEERELHSKNDKNEKIDVRKGINNKINTKPTVSEEVKEWVDELISEGYNLSEFTWDEVTEIYESAELDEASTYGMPPAGDAQREKPDPLQAAKRRAAQAQVRKELSDLQLAKVRSQAKLSTSSEEAIINYLENRYDLSEGVFDPKKSKLRSASERRKTELSPAQKKAAEMKQKRSERLESEADKVLRKVRGGSSTRRSSKPMGSEAPAPKAPAPEANRKLGKEKQDTLAKKASDVLKDVKNK